MTFGGVFSCNICGRTFEPDRLEVHKRSCKPKPPKAAAKGRGRAMSVPRGRAKKESQPKARAAGGDSECAIVEESLVTNATPGSSLSGREVLEALE
jgi:hypothetical protein